MSYQIIFKTVTKLLTTLAAAGAGTATATMVYLKDFEYLKPRTTKVTHLQTFSNTKIKKSSPTKEVTLKEILKPYVKEYCDTSAVHGLRYLTHSEMKYYEKGIWLIILIATSIGCCVVYFELAELYYTQRIQTTVADSVYPVFMIPFPSVGICHGYRINWQRLHTEAYKIFLPADVSNATLNTFFEFFQKMSDLQFTSMHKLSSLFEHGSGINLTAIDHLDILKVVEYLTYDCNEAFTGFCRWRGKHYNCCELFTLERTEVGFCYVFNSAVGEKAQAKASSERFYPYHNSNAGEGTGLEVRLRINEELIDPSFSDIHGVYVMIKQSEQWFADVKFVNYNTFTKLAISAQITETSKRIRDIPPEERRCIFGDEVNHHLFKQIPGLPYWRGNCRTKCHQEYLLKYCKCNLNMLFPTTSSDNFTLCKPSDFKCMYDNANIFRTEHHIYESQYIDDTSNDSMTCNCLNNCNQLLYDGFFNSFPLEGVNSTDSVKIVHMDIHFQTTFILKYRTQIRYTFVELLANFGGIIGLFLGASMLSGIELVYYFTIGLYARLHKQLEDRFRQKTPNAQGTRIKYKQVQVPRMQDDDIHYKY